MGIQALLFFSFFQSYAAVSFCYQPLTSIWKSLIVDISTCLFARFVDILCTILIISLLFQYSSCSSHKDTQQTSYVIGQISTQTCLPNPNNGQIHCIWGTADKAVKITLILLRFYDRHGSLLHVCISIIMQMTYIMTMIYFQI